jgi:flagellar biosynthesis protein FlhF
MKIKKYIAPNFNTGKKQILAELGEDAVILSTRNIHKPDSEESSVEIVAAIDEKNIKKEAKRPVKDKLSGLESMLNAARAEAQRMSPSKVNNYEQKSDIHDELYDIKVNINKIFDSLKYKYTPSLKPNLANVYRKIIDNEFSEDYALSILNELITLDSNLEFNDVLEKAKEKIIESIKIGKQIKSSSSRQVISMIGPTGAGKTMALIKLAIIMNLLGKKVFIISADTYKVGGSEQLSTYASIAGIPFKTAYGIKDLKKFLNDENDYDFVFIDTKGVSYRNHKHIFEVADQIKAINPDRNFLVLPANISKASLDELLDETSSIKFTDIILTKLDESAKIGGVISGLSERKLPISYLTYGQNVPDDISPADSTKLGHIALPLGKKIDIIKLLDE